MDEMKVELWVDSMAAKRAVTMVEMKVVLLDGMLAVEKVEKMVGTSVYLLAENSAAKSGL